MVIKINRNTRSANGEYVINTFSSDEKGENQDTEKKYPVKMKNNKIIPTEKIEDSKIREEIEEFKFFAQYADFKGTSLGYKDVKYTFVKNQKENIHFSDSIKFMPSED